MKKKWGIILILIILVACSKETENNESIDKYHDQLMNKEREIQRLKNEINRIEAEHSEFLRNLQIVDGTSKNVLSLISEGDFEELKKEYNVEFELVDDGILFTHPEHNAPFHIEFATSHSYIHGYAKTDTGIGLSYYILDQANDKYRLMYFHFDNDLNFKYIYVGAE